MIGVLLGTVYDSPKNILAIKNINRLKDAGVESCLFCDIVNRNFSVPVETSVLQRAQAFNFNGSVITHDLSMAQELRHMVYAKKRYLYLYDLDWMRIEDLHFKLISDMFKKPKHTMEYWDANVLKELD